MNPIDSASPSSLSPSHSHCPLPGFQQGHCGNLSTDCPCLLSCAPPVHSPGNRTLSHFLTAEKYHLGFRRIKAQLLPKVEVVFHKLLSYLSPLHRTLLLRRLSAKPRAHLVVSWPGALRQALLPSLDALFPSLWSDKLLVILLSQLKCPILCEVFPGCFWKSDSLLL